MIKYLENNRVIDLHIIQSTPTSNLNRDENGNPKTTRFGGVKRGRVSSQAEKRASRDYMQDNYTTDGLFGTRSRLFATESVIPEVQERCPGVPVEKITAIVGSFINGYLARMDKDKDAAVASNIIFLSSMEITEIAYLVAENIDLLLDKSTSDIVMKKIWNSLVKKFKTHPTALDIALWGRMMTIKSEIAVDAATQVAHAISTHPFIMEDDFFSAIDDLAAPGSGAAMVGNASCGSACFYKYANLHRNTLIDNLRGDKELTKLAAEYFLDSFVKSMPSGKQNSYAALTPPSLVVAVVRNSGCGLSLANSFEKPVSPDRDGGYITPSALALEEGFKRAKKLYGKQIVGVSLFNLDNLPVTEFGESVDDFDAWLEKSVQLLDL